LVILFVIVLANLRAVSANGADVHEEQSSDTPVWVYYVEIVEHTLMMLIGLVAVWFLVKAYKKHENITKQGVFWMIVGLVIFILGQLLTNLHHFLISPFGVWTAIVHHGLYAISILVIIVAFFKLLRVVE